MVNRNDILDALGLQESGFSVWFVPAIIGFGVGSLLGAGIALLLAPKPGAELREGALTRGRNMVERGREQIASTTPTTTSPSTHPRSEPLAPARSRSRPARTRCPRQQLPVIPLHFGERMNYHRRCRGVPSRVRRCARRC